MLKLTNIVKTYSTSSYKVNALKGIDLEFRKSEFVSILGPSGCGKTTLLNIIGGLDRYTSGDLVINGISTKKYKDKDWDTYRNHSVGFVFQSYNLIPHQTVLQNVELALTLSGVTKKERRKRATKVLEKVGLKDKINSRPNQLSGGQMQRVAIARALVNDPEIILADEPTGALDSKTSVQVMELLKEISKDKLIIMVTHNPELAKEYSSRIVELLDGKVTHDSNPITKKEVKETSDEKLLSMTEDSVLSKKELRKKNKKKRMSFFTALSLSFKNLLTKKGRTILVSFAGSIGIIGIALILAISSGFSTYINKMQEDTLASYPIEVKAKNVDYTSVIASFFAKNLTTESTKNHEFDGVYNSDSLSKIMNSVGSNLKANNLTKFKNYIDSNYDQIKDYVSGVQYVYSLNSEFYADITDITDNSQMITNIQPNSQALMKMILQYSILYFQNDSKLTLTPNLTGGYSITTNQNSNSSFLKSFEKSVPALTIIKQALFEKVDDLPEDDTNNYVTPKDNATTTISSQTVLALAFQLIGFGNMIDTETGSIKSSGMSMMGSSDIFYEMIDNEKLLSEQYDILAKMEGVDIFENFGKTNTNEALLVLDKNNEIEEYVLYALGLLNDTQISSILDDMVKDKQNSIKLNYNDILGKTFKILDETDYYIDIGGNITDFRTLYDQTKPLTDANNLAYLSYYKQAIHNSENSVQIVGIVKLNDNTNSGFLKTGVAYTKHFTNQMIDYHNSKVEEKDLGSTIAKTDITTPTEIDIYINSFDAKAKVKEFIEKYNLQASNGDEITYTDTADLVMSTVSTIINAITYVLVAFVSVSLVVSSIMIGIITYISVIERTKEIGVLRSVGASKRDVKRVFTAESFIIGLTSGVFGIVISFILTIPINILLKSFTGIAGLASLPIVASLVLVAISITLTFISGLIPARSASKKDPVIALRTE